MPFEVLTSPVADAVPPSDLRTSEHASTSSQSDVRDGDELMAIRKTAGEDDALIDDEKQVAGDSPILSDEARLAGASSPIVSSNPHGPGSAATSAKVFGSHIDLLSLRASIKSAASNNTSQEEILDDPDATSDILLTKGDSAFVASQFKSEIVRLRSLLEESLMREADLARDAQDLTKMAYGEKEASEAMEKQVVALRKQLDAAAAVREEHELASIEKKNAMDAALQELASYRTRVQDLEDAAQQHAKTIDENEMLKGLVQDLTAKLELLAEQAISRPADSTEIQETKLRDALLAVERDRALLDAEREKISLEKERLMLVQAEIKQDKLALEKSAREAVSSEIVDRIADLEQMNSRLEMKVKSLTDGAQGRDSLVAMLQHKVNTLIQDNRRLGGSRRTGR